MNGTSMPASVDDVDRLAIATVIDDVLRDIDDEVGDYQEQLNSAIADLQISMERNEGSSSRTVDNINVMSLRFVIESASENLEYYDYTGDYGDKLAEAVARLEQSLDNQTHSDDDDTVNIDRESASVALRELALLINHTQGEEPDPLTDDVFRAKKNIEDAINNSQ
jgi:hypothetical protein